MPCLFLRNVPSDTKWDPDEIKLLYMRIATAARCNVDAVEIHIESTQYVLLKPDGTQTNKHGVHGFVEWHKGRSLAAKKAIGQSIHIFLGLHGLGAESDITFRDYPKGETYIFEGKLIK